MKKDNNENKEKMIAEQQNRFVINNKFSLSEVKVGKTCFVVACHFSDKNSFENAIEKVIEYKLKAS